MSHSVRVESERRRTDQVGWVCAAASAVALFALSWWRHKAYWTGFDLAIFDQAVWQISEGRAQISIVDRHVLADHLSPVLYAFGPLYRVAPSVGWLLAAQAVAVGSAVVAMRRVATTLGASPLVATALTLGSAPLLAAALFDFHPSTLAVPFIAWALAFAVEGRPLLSTAAAVGVALCRADLALVILGIAILSDRRVRWPLVGVSGAMAGASALIPGHFGPTNGWAPHYGHLGESPLQALLHPWDVAAELVSGGTLATVAVWVLAAGALVATRPRWMVALVVSGLPVLLSRWVGTELPWYHYGAPMVPIAIGGTLEASRALKLRGPSRHVTWLGPVLALLVASPLAPGAPHKNRVWTVPGGNEPAEMRAVLAEVHSSDTVSAEQWLLPHLSQREQIYLFPLPFAGAPGFFADGSDPEPSAQDAKSVTIVLGRRALEHLMPSSLSERTYIGGWVVARR